LNPVLRGWGNYFRMANCKTLYGELAGWIRRRLRAKQIALWKKPSRLIRRLRQVGWQGEIQAMRMSSWRTSPNSYASMAINNGYLADLGLFDLASIQPESYLKAFSTVKQEPYTVPYVRFCERDESAVAPLAHPTR